MAIPPVKSPPPPRRSVQVWNPSRGLTTARVSTLATSPIVGKVQPAPRPIMGNDVQTVTITVPGIAGSGGTTVTTNVPFSNIAGFTASGQDQALFHVYIISTDIPPAGVTIAGHNITPKAFQGFSGPAVYPQAGGPLSVILPAGGLSGGVTYQSFSADISFSFINTSVNPSSSGTMNVVLGAHIINQTG